MNQNDNHIVDEFQRLRSVTPDDEECRRALDRARQSLIQQPSSKHWFTGRIGMLARIAACVTLVAALGIIPLSGIWQRDHDGTLLADMIETLRKTQNASFRTTTTTRETVDGERQKPHTQVVRYWLTADGRGRSEHEGWVTMIGDRKQGKILEYDMTTKKAHVFKAPKPILDMYQHLKNLDVRRYSKLGEKTIDGRRAAGFVVPDGDKLYVPGVEIWIDVETKLPLRIEGRFGEKDDADQVEISDRFVFDDPNLDYAIFDLRVPDGFALQDTPVIETMWVEDDGQLKTSEEQRAADATVLVAGMINNVKKARNVSFRFKRKVRTGIGGEETKFSESTYREWIDATGASRQETSEGIISVVSWKQRKVMLLNKKAKTATVVAIPENESPENVYENLKNTNFQNYEKVPEKEIDGKMAIGFVAPPTNVKHTFAPGVTVWVDQETRLPIRIEGKFGPNKDDPDDQFVIDQIIFDDPKVVPSMIEIKVPAGYELQQKPMLKFSGNLKDE
jgi:outer membrane lipoprotein-sorting protein